MEDYSQQLQAMTPAQRADFMRDNCDDVKDEEHYWRDVTPFEKEEHSRLMTQKMVSTHSLKAEAKESAKTYKANIDKLVLEVDEHLNIVHSGRIKVKEKIYGFKNHESNFMEYVNDQGILMYQRPLKPEERQSSVMSIVHGGANGLGATGTGG